MKKRCDCCGHEDVQFSDIGERTYCSACHRHISALMHQSAAQDVPIVHDFWEGVRAEKEHQRKRWGDPHDRNKTQPDWFWLVGYLAGKALHAAAAGDIDKAKHHTISTAAVLAMWHESLSTAHDPTRASDLEKSIGERS